MNIRKAQSSMEYLMTYGWAILIVAVSLGTLYDLGIFNGSSLAGQSCVAAPGYYCQNLALPISGYISFTFGQESGSKIFNIEMACGATSGSGGYPSNSASWSFILTNGLATNVINDANLNNAIDLNTAQTVQVSGLQCYGPASTPETNLVIGATYSGYVWLNYTTSPCIMISSWTAPQGNQWYTAKPLSVTTKVI